MPKDNSFKKDQGEIVIYQTEDGKTKIDVRFIDETVWLTQQQLGELFQSSRSYTSVLMQKNRSWVLLRFPVVFLQLWKSEL